MGLHHTLRDAVDTYGRQILVNADAFRAVLDDVVDEGEASPGELNLVVDAVRFGAVDQLIRLVDTGASPERAVHEVGGIVASRRGGADPRATSWACSVVGYALGRVPEGVVSALRTSQANTAAPMPPRHAPPTVAPRPYAAPTQAAYLHPVQGPSYGVPLPPAGRPGRRRLGLALAAGAVALVVAVGATTAALVAAGEASSGGSGGSGDSGESVLTADESLSGSTSSEPSETATSEAAPSETASPTMTPSAEKPFQCWDGSRAMRLAECSNPAGLEGLGWVFPRSSDETCYNRGGGPGRAGVYCDLTLNNGGVVTYHYSHWRTWVEMRDDFESRRLSSVPLTLGRTDLLGFPVNPSRNGQDKAAVFYRNTDAPWSITVYADTQGDLSRAISRVDALMIGFKSLRGVRR